MLSNFPGPLIELLLYRLKKFLAFLATMVSASAIDGAIQGKIHKRKEVKARKETTLIISIEDIYDIFRIIKLLKNLGVLIDGVSKKLKHEINHK